MDGHLCAFFVVNFLCYRQEQPNKQQKADDQVGMQRLLAGKREEILKT